MKKIIITESQERELVNKLNEDVDVQQMPVDKKMNKPYCIDPEKVKIVRKYLDDGYTHKVWQHIGPDGKKKKTTVVIMNADNGEELKPLFLWQMKDLLIDEFQNMFSDHNERDLFMGQVLKDWINNRIGVHGTLSVNSLNESTVTSDMVDERAAETNTDPTEKQKEAGNYKMGHISIKGMAISIENPKGSIRKGTDGNGAKWEREMKNHYGYFTNTTGNGKDGDAVDVFIGPHPDDFDRVYVVDQKVDGVFDESKVLIGFYSKDEAKDAYMSNYDPDWKGFWKITGVSLKTFKRWLYRERKQRKPFFDYVTIKKHKIEESSAINEEEYGEIVKICTMFDEKAAIEVAEELRAKGIDAYNQRNGLYAIIERDRLYPYYVDEVKEFARKIAMEYMKTHSDSVEQVSMLRESFEKSDMDVNGWRIVRRNDGLANLRNDETGKFASDVWYNWVGYPSELGISVVKNNTGYNLMKTDGTIMLPKWFDDVLDTSNPNIFKIVDDDGVYELDIRTL
jgi:hypothetical protein